MQERLSSWLAPIENADNNPTLALTGAIEPIGLAGEWVHEKPLNASLTKSQ